MNKYEVYMAPMQGVTEAPFRNLFEQYFGGIDAYYTPFIRWEHGGVRRKDLRDISPDRNSVCKLVPQLLAGTADEAESILQYIIDCGYREVDINMGCAYPVLAKKGKGSGILAHPEQVADLLQVVHRHSQVKFSVKMRFEFDDIGFRVKFLDKDDNDMGAEYLARCIMNDLLTGNETIEKLLEYLQEDDDENKSVEEIILQ